MLRWFGVKEGDEVILPAYTYAATANVIIHCGAKPVFVDVNASDFNINTDEIRKAITPRTKVIMPVDFGGWPCDYNTINAIAAETRSIFSPDNEIQKQLRRVLVLADAAHSIGAIYKRKKTGSLTDVSVFSFHAVKNLTTAEGGAVALNLPAPFNNDEIYAKLCVSTLHGQNKDALAKMQRGNWKYDIVEAGYKCNMTDIVASIGLVELARYDQETLVKREKIVDQYNWTLSAYPWSELPLFRTADSFSSCHVYPLRIKGINEEQRDAIIQKIFERDVSVNVHFIPVPMTSFYKSLGYDIKNYPVAYKNFSREISLPVFFDMTDDMVKQVIDAVVRSVIDIIGTGK